MRVEVHGIQGHVMECWRTGSVPQQGAAALRDGWAGRVSLVSALCIYKDIS